MKFWKCVGMKKSIADILDMTVSDAMIFFAWDESAKRVPAAQKRLIQKLTPLEEVGLGYVTLGQSSNTLSGGEAQRIKLATFLSRGDRQEHIRYSFSTSPPQDCTHMMCRNCSYRSMRC